MNAVGKGTIAGAFMICIILFVGMCLFIAAWSIVDPTYMAIARNKMTSHIEEDKVYFEGRHFLGVGYEFIFYPMAWQLVEYTDDVSVGKVDYVCKVDSPLDASTSEGSPMNVELSLYFTIPPQQLINFYTSYGINYQDSIANDCKKVLKDTLTHFSHEEVLKNRSTISGALVSALKRSLSRRRCVLEKLLLRGVNFTETIEAQNEDNVISQQKSTAAGYENLRKEIEEQCSTMKKEYAYEINKVISNAQKNATVLIEEAKAYATSIYANSTSYAWQKYQEVTELDTASLLRVQWARTLGATTSKDSISLGYDKVGSGFVQKVNQV